MIKGSRRKHTLYSILGLFVFVFIISVPQRVHSETYMESGRSSVAKLSASELRELYKNIGTYNTLYATEPTLNGNYAISTLTADAYQSGLDWINYYRAVAGVDSVTFTDSLNESAAYGALVDAANKTLSHTPSQPSDMNDTTYNLGYTAASSSNLSYSSGYSESSILSVAINGQISDSGSSNISRVGHRRWLLHPNIKTMGIGSANNGNYYYTAVRVIGVDSQTVSDYDFISWPASGYNATETFSVSNPWSITLNPAKYSAPSSSTVKVTLTDESSGQQWVFDNSTDTSSIGSAYNYFCVDNQGYGVNNCIIFRPAYANISSYSGDYIVKVEGITDKSGNSVTISYKVSFIPAVYKDISSSTITLTNSSYTYTGNEQTPAVTVKYGNTTLSKGENYTVSYSNNVNAGTASVTITGIGNYYGSVSKTFTINKANQNLTVNSSAMSLKEGASASIIADGQGTISYASSNTDIVTVSNTGVMKGIAAGTATVTVSASGNANYNSATKTITVTVTKNTTDISACSISLKTDYDYEDMGDYIYDGTAKIPEITVKNGTTTLVEGTDYECTFTDNVNAGTAKVIITGIGDYSGQVTKEYTIDKASQELTTDCTALKIPVGETNYIEASGIGTITFKSGNTSLATVDDKGVITAIKEGSTYIYVTAVGDENHNSVTERVELTVIAARSEQKITYSLWTNDIPENGTLSINANAQGATTYQSSDPSVATVDSYGVITGVKEGTATITINASKTLQYFSASESFEIKVDDKEAIGQGYCGGDTTQWYMCSDGTLRITGQGEVNFSTINGHLNWSEFSDQVKDVYVEDGITGLGNTFYSLWNHDEFTSSPETITLADTVTSIGQNAFAGCDKLKIINIGSGLSSIDEGWSYGCSALEEINVSSDNASYTSIDGALYSKDKKTLIQHPAVTEESVVIPDGVETLKKGSLRYMSSMTSLTIPESVNTIESSACYDCDALKDIYYAGDKTAWDKISGNSTFKSKTIHYGKTISISDAALTLSQASYSYDGNAKKPEVTVTTSDGTLLTEDQDYTVSYSDNTNAGTATVTVSGKNAYSGTLSQNYTITKASQTVTVSPASLSMNVGDSKTITVSGYGTITYTSSDISVAKVDSSGKVSGLAAGNATITVKAAGNSNYNAANKTVSVTVTKNAVDLSTCTITLENASYTYDGEAKTPAVTVKDGTTTLTKGTDYSLIYEDNTNAGTANVTVTGKGNYTGSVARTFTISKADQDISVSPASLSLNVGDSETITASANGSITYTSSDTSVATVSTSGSVKAISVGSATITVKAAGNSNYNSASKTVSVTVSKASVSMSSCDISIAGTSYIYDGSAKTPAITVKNGSTTLTNGTDYSVSYSNNTNAGTATVTISGKGDYTGSVNKTFTISKADQTFSVSPTNLSMKVGDYESIDVSADGNITSITFASSDTSIVTVSTIGGVKAISAGTATITVKVAGDSNHNVASKTIDVTINNDESSNKDEVPAKQISITECKYELTQNSYVYDGTAKTPGIVIKYGDKILEKDKDYRLGYQNNIDAGYALVDVEGIGSYKNSRSIAFRIYPASTIIAASNYTKTASSRTQSFFIGANCNSGNPLSYSSNSKSVSVTAQGNVSIKAGFCGRAIITITAGQSANYAAASENIIINVVPAKISWKALKAPSKRQMKVSWGRNKYADGYQISYSTSSKFSGKTKTITLGKSKNAVISKTVKSLTSKKVYYVRIRAYKKVGSTKIYGSWSSVKRIKAK